MAKRQAKLNLPGTRSHPISAWLESEEFYLKSPFYIACEDYYLDRLWVAFDACIGLHQATHFPLVPFDKSREACWDYLTQACTLLSRPRPGWGLGSVDRAIVKEALGLPPFASYSIYMITVADLDGKNERVVYIGKTNANSNRFTGGHAAMSKLHAPEYDGLTKKVFMGCVVGMNDDDHYIPVEWMNEDLGRDNILTDVESQLIFHLKPELNRKGVRSDLTVKPMPLAIDNVAGSKYLDGYFCGPASSSERAAEEAENEDETGETSA